MLKAVQEAFFLQISYLKYHGVSHSDSLIGFFFMHIGGVILNEFKLQKGLYAFKKIYIFVCHVSTYVTGN